MQSFRMQEIVLIGSSEAALGHRESWLPRAVALLSGLGLDITQEVANDPFFGRPGRVLTRGQLEKELKFELLAPVDGDGLVAIASANYHEDHMGLGFDISLEGGGPAHSACMGFGLDRVALALFSMHGVELTSWPMSVRQGLGLG
jgi:seryl-tRNA synthetase